MKTLLTGKEHCEDIVNIYNENYTAFTINGKEKGKAKQVATDWINETDAVLLYGALKRLGLDDYIQTCYHENKLYIRIIEGEG